MVKVLLVRGAPKFLKTEISAEYYNDIINFIGANGGEVSENPDDFEAADVVVSHGKAVPLLDALPEIAFKKHIKFGYPGGICNPDDLDWQSNGSKGIPPDDHLVFSADQKLALQDVFKSHLIPSHTRMPRQSAAERPKVR